MISMRFEKEYDSPLSVHLASQDADSKILQYFQGFRSDIDEKGAPRSSGNGSKTGSQHVESKG